MSDDEATSAGAYSDSLDRVVADLEAVEAALGRLDDGTYGRCSVCGGEIAEDDLIRDPLATTCAAHGAAPTGAGAAPAAVSERAVGVLAGDDPFALGGEHPER